MPREGHTVFAGTVPSVLVEFKMDKFFSLAGEFVSHEIITVGETPRVTVIAVFTYPNGESRYDGRAWTYRIFF